MLRTLEFRGGVPRSGFQCLERDCLGSTSICWGGVDEVGPGSARDWDHGPLQEWRPIAGMTMTVVSRESSAPSVFILQILILGSLDSRAPQVVG